MLKGIDVSKWQGNIDWNKVKADGMQFAIIRASYAQTGLDPMFKNNVNGAKAVGIPIGAYHYCYAKTVSEAKAEAKHFLNVIKGIQFEWPICLDIEDEQAQGNLTTEERTNIAIAFLEEIESAGYYAMIYANKHWFTSKLNDSRLQPYAHWVAQYNSECTYSGGYGIWQHSSSGRVNGIKGNVDMNIAYIDYQKEVKSRGLNGFSKAKSPAYPNKSHRYTKPIMTGDNIKLIQSKLKDKGFYTGKIDGSFGPLTDKAVRAFQKAKGLSVDGSVGPITWKALFN